MGPDPATAPPPGPLPASLRVGDLAARPPLDRNKLGNGEVAAVEVSLRPSDFAERGVPALEPPPPSAEAPCASGPASGPAL